LKSVLNLSLFLIFFYWSIGGGNLSSSAKPQYIFLNHLIFFTIIFFSLLKIYTERKITYHSISVIPILFILISTSFSTLFSKYPRMSLEEFLNFLLYIFWFFFIINYQNYENLLKIILNIASIISLIGIFQYLSQNIKFFQIYSTLENPNIFAGYLILIIFLSFIFLNEKIYRFYLFLFLITIFLTFSRGAYISTIFGIFLFYGISKNLFKKFWFYILGLSFVILTITLTFFYFERAKPSIKERILLYKSTLKMIKENPITGGGISTFSIVYPKYIYNEYIPQIRWNRFHSHSHSTYLNITYEGGFFYLFSFLFFIITFLKLLIKQKNNFNTAVLTSICSFLIFSITDYLLNIFLVNLIFWTILGIGVRVNVRLKEIKLNKKIIILFFFLIFLLFFQIFKIDLAHFYFKIGVDYANLGDFISGEFFLEKAINLDKNFSVYYNNLARVHQNLYKLTKEKKYLEKAKREIGIAEKLNPYQKFTYKRYFKISSPHLEFILYKRRGIKDEIRKF
jgi:O-antigen ligase